MCSCNLNIKSNFGPKKVHKTIRKTEYFQIFSRIRGPRFYKAPPPKEIHVVTPLFEYKHKFFFSSGTPG